MPRSLKIAGVDHQAQYIVRANPVLAYILYPAAATLFLGSTVSFGSISPWVPIGIFWCSLVVIQMALLCRARVPFLHLLLFVYGVQFLLASLAIYFYPVAATESISNARYPIYLSYIIPAWLALSGGVLLASHRLRASSFTSPKLNGEGLPWARRPVFLCLGGLFIYLAIPFLPGANEFRFFLLLLANLRWVGVFVLLLSDDKRWRFYGALVFGVELFFALSGGMFQDLVLWSECAFLVLAYRFRWQFKTLLFLVLLTAFAVVFQSVKGEYRKVTWQGHSTVNKYSVMGELIVNRLDTSDSHQDPNAYADALVRFNQGWIVDRVMRRIPAVYPYADGSTILEGLEAALLPRFLQPGKATAGGQKLFEKYTGQRLGGSTSMTISVMGEMYANFGPYGGIAGMGVLGILLGTLYRSIAKRAQSDPVWWAWWPFLGFWAMKPEEDLMNVENWIFKGFVVMGMVMLISNRIEAVRHSRAVRTLNVHGAAPPPGADSSPQLEYSLQ